MDLEEMRREAFSPNGQINKKNAYGIIGGVFFPLKEIRYVYHFEKG